MGNDDNKTNRKSISIGMFDIIKGIGVLYVIADHTLWGCYQDLFSLRQNCIYNLLHNLVIPMFLIVSGYGFRKIKPEKGIRQQAKFLLIPFAATGLASAFVNLANIFLGIPLFDTVKRSIQLFNGMALGASEELFFGARGYRVALDTGTAWYFLDLFLSWLLIMLIFKYFSGKKAGLVVLIVMAAGITLGSVITLPYCILPAMAGSGYCYFGYQLKKKKFFEKSHSPGLIVALTALSAASGLLGRFNLGSCTGDYGIIDVLLAGAAGFEAVLIGVWLNTKNFPIKEQIQWFGRNALVLLSAHTVEYHALRWDKIIDLFKLQGRPAAVAVILFKIALVSLVCVIFKKAKHSLKQLNIGRKND